jgi:predicted metalloprotease with PDZ domain
MSGRIARDYTDRMQWRSTAGRKRPRIAILKLSAMAVVFLGVVAQPTSVVLARAQSRVLPAPQPIAYIVRFEPATHFAQIDATFPTDRRSSIDVMMAIWSPGFYRIENYANRVRSISARTDRGVPVGIAPTRPNRWRVETGGAGAVVVSYRLYCVERSVTTNTVNEAFAVLNGPATFMTLADSGQRVHEVRIELPHGWARAMTALDRLPDAPEHYRAADFDTLADSPIVAGNPLIHQFEVDGRVHSVVQVGDVGGFDGARAAADLKKIVEAHRKLWGELPYKEYKFLLAFRQGGGGLEHKDSTLATTRATVMQTPASYLTWLNFISHEYCHAFNVKRLRPIELGPFDYEREPHTPSLWISEGFTSYFGELAVERAGLSRPADILKSLTARIEQLQRSPGRLVQTLEQASLDVWTSESISGVNTNANTSVSYYMKGQIAAFLLDARIRRATGGARSLDDVMRLAYRRYGGSRGFTPDDFRATASEVAGADLSGWFKRTVSSTQEIDYDDALDWYGLRFAAGTWTLERRDDASAKQKARLTAWLGREP